MKSIIKSFKNEMFGEVRTKTNEMGETFFVGRDVAIALGYTNTQKAIRDHVDKEDKLTERIVLSGQNRSIIFINESGLYALIFSSKLEQANRREELLRSIDSQQFQVVQYYPKIHILKRIIMGQWSEGCQKLEMF